MPTKKQYWEMTAEEKREAFIQGLLDVAHIFENNPALPVPKWDTDVTVYVRPEDAEGNPVDAKAIFRDFIAACGGTDKDVDDFYFRMNWQYGPVRLRVLAERDEVCERVVVGQKIVPAQEAYLVPAREERVEDIVEWKCSSILDTK